MSFHIIIKAFEHGKKIPEKHTCNGDNVSPEIGWHEAPKNTVTFALICEDPDAPGGVFTHWIVYNLPSDCHELEEMIPIEKKLDNGAIHGKTSFGTYGYGGPCPPKGENHRYLFKVFALKKKLRPDSANTREDLYEAIDGFVIDQAVYMGIYSH